MSKEAPPELWQQMLDDSDEERAAAAWDKIALHYQYLVEATARSTAKRLPAHLDDMELISLGQTGLLKAIDKYRPEQGDFSRYASVLVYGAIMDGLRQADFAPRGLRRQQRDLDRAIQDLRVEGITSPTVEQIATKIELEVDEVRTIQHRVARAEVAPTDPGLLPSTRTASASDSLWSRELCREFVVWLKKFDTDTQKVIALKYWKGLSMKAISETLGLQVESVRQSHQAVLRQILPFMQDMARED